MTTNMLLLKKLNLKDINTREVLELLEMENTLEPRKITSFLTEEELMRLDKLQFEN